MTTMKAIAYYRVSTDKQGKSGLGLDAQREAIRSFLAGKGWPPVLEVTEVESGRNNDRPQLAAALAACKLHKATLVIAKLDRLSRDAHFLMGLHKAGVDFVAVDNPNANKLTIGILALVAQDEAERTSARTKAALAAAKARGTKLGGHRGYSPNDMDRSKAAQAKAMKAVEDAQRVKPTIDVLALEGVTSLGGIARALNDQGITTAQGKLWQATTVKRVLDKLAEATA